MIANDEGWLMNDDWWMIDNMMVMVDEYDNDDDDDDVDDDDDDILMMTDDWLMNDNDWWTVDEWLMNDVLLHTEIILQKKETLRRKHLLTVNFCIMFFCTEKLFHADAFWHGSFYRETIALSSFHTQKHLRREASTRSSFHTQKRMCREAFTRSSFNTQMFLRKAAFAHDASTHRRLYTEQFLHGETFACGNFYIENMAHRCLYAQYLLYCRCTQKF